MAIDFNDILEKAGTELLASNDMMTKSMSNAQGLSITKRDISELAALDTIVRNKQATAERDANGITSLFERDFH
jgi:hypothetical protein